jgi:hypothetical protein
MEGQTFVRRVVGPRYFFDAATAKSALKRLGKATHKNLGTLTDCLLQNRTTKRDNGISYKVQFIVSGPVYRFFGLPACGQLFSRSRKLLGRVQSVQDLIELQDAGLPRQCLLVLAIK